MSRSDEARRLQEHDLERRARAVAGDPGAAAAIVYVTPDGTLTVACSCGEELAHPSGRQRYTLQRLGVHMELHSTAAEHGLPWGEVQARRERLARSRPLRDDDPPHDGVVRPAPTDSERIEP